MYRSPVRRNVVSSSRLLGLALFAVLAPAGAVLAEQPSPLELGSRRELFVDRYLIERLENAWLQLHAPRDEGPVIKFDLPWEGPHAGYCTLLVDGGRYLMYYRGVSQPGPDGSPHERTCVAESADGLAWTKPKLGLFAFQGDSQNNLVLADAAPVTHNFCPLLDTRPGTPAEERFKAVGGTVDKLFAYVSADGLNWRRMQEAPVLTKSHVPFPHQHLFDSQNLAFWSQAEGCYVCYFRVWDGLRRIARSTSSDFVHWSPAVLMRQVHDDGQKTSPAPAEHLYTNQTSPYFRAPHIYLAIAARFFPGRQVVSEEQAQRLKVNADYFHDTSDAVLLSSRGGDQYDRTFLEGFLRPGIGLQNWVSRTNYPALNLAPTGEHELSLYVNQDYAQPTSHIRRYSLRTDGFASLRAGAKAGEMLSRPFTFSGRKLEINFSTSAAGGLRFELQDAAGSPIAGYSLEDCQEQIGNEIARVVSWKGGEDLGGLAGKTVRLRCRLQDADLFSLRFAD